MRLKKYRLLRDFNNNEDWETFKLGLAFKDEDDYKKWSVFKIKVRSFSKGITVKGASVDHLDSPKFY